MSFSTSAMAHFIQNKLHLHYILIIYLFIYLTRLIT